MKKCRMFLLLSIIGILVSGALSATVCAEWINNASGGHMYRPDASSAFVTGFAKIGDYTYYFDEEGIMQTGFLTVGRKTYYLNALGQLQFGRFVASDGKTYYGDKATGALVKNQWVKNHYYRADGSMASDAWLSTNYVEPGVYSGIKRSTGWVTVDGQKYYYNAKGVPVKGKLLIDGKLYYFDTTTGAMKKGLFQAGGNYYFAKSNGVLVVNAWKGGRYFRSDGTAATGWSEINGKSYLLTQTGVKCNGWTTYRNVSYYCVKGVVQKNAWIQGQKYYVLASGAKAFGWQNIGNYTYYFNPRTGVRKTGRIRVGAVRYYLDSFGRLCRGTWVDSKMYYASASGALLTGLQNINGSLYFFKANGKKVVNKMKTIGTATYYFKNDGAAAKDLWVKLGSDYYYFQKNGRLVKNKWVGNYYVDLNGARTNQTKKTGWQTVGGHKYYYTSKGSLVLGWKNINGSEYYFDSSTGVMAVGLQTINDRKYYFYSDGRMAASLTIAVGMKEYTIASNGVITAEKSIKISGNSTGVKIANFALQYVGNPYVWGGTSLTQGADCSGFVQTVFANFGIKLLRVADDQMKGPSSNISSEYKRPVVVDASSMLPGDLIFYGASNYASHVAIYMGNGQIVHASNSQPYPQGGIKISDYDYQTPVRIVRYWS